MTKIIPVIMSGGAGSRLWPLSRQSEPKQLLPLISDQTMVQETVARFDDELFADPVFICNELHVEAIEAQMSQMGRVVDAIIVEPMGRNTAPCAVVAACHGAQKSDHLVMLVPADHHVKDKAAFTAAIKKAVKSAQDGYLVTFGITPDAPETGYGYIAQGETLEAGVFKVDAFREKPDAATAQTYLDAGHYAWNAGIFLFSPQSFLSEAQAHAADIAKTAEAAYAASSRRGAVVSLPKDLFAACPSESIDYAVMEHTTKAAIVPCDIGWNDIGSYASLKTARSEIDADAAGNSVRGSVMIDGSENCLVDTDSLPVSLVGMKDVAVIVKNGEILVVNLEQSQAVKNIVGQLKANGETGRL